MSSTTKRCATAILALGLSIAGASIYADAQDTSGQTPQADRRPGPGGRRGPGGPGGGGRFGDPAGRGPMGHGGPFGPRALDRLDATPAQREQIHAVLQSHAAAREGLRARAATATEALRAAIAAVPLDEAGIRAESALRAAVQADAAVLQARMRAEVLEVLTPEQRELFTAAPSHQRGRRGGPPAR